MLCQTGPEGGQDALARLVEWAWDVASGGESVAAAAKLEGHLGDVETRHGPESNLDLTIFPLDEDGGGVHIVGADEEAHQPSVAIPIVAAFSAHGLGDLSPDDAVFLFSLHGSERLFPQENGSRGTAFEGVLRDVGERRAGLHQLERNFHHLGCNVAGAEPPGVGHDTGQQARGDLGVWRDVQVTQ